MRNDLDLYEQNASSWWDADSRAFRSLHRVNAFRMALLNAWIGPDWQARKVVDLGCGGGLSCEHLARQGADIIGVDQGFQGLQAARRAATKEGGRRRYIRADIRQAPLQAGTAEVVLLADVLEHVTPFAQVVAEAARITADNGFLYVNTISRTLRARWLAVHAAELLGFIPRGTHDPRLFIRPEELTAVAREVGLDCLHLQGESPRLLATIRRGAIELKRSRSLALAYSALFRKLPTGIVAAQGSAST